MRCATPGVRMDSSLPAGWLLCSGCCGGRGRSTTDVRWCVLSNLLLRGAPPGRRLRWLGCTWLLWGLWCWCHRCCRWLHIWWRHHGCSWHPKWCRGCSWQHRSKWAVAAALEIVVWVLNPSKVPGAHSMILVVEFAAHTAEPPLMAGAPGVCPLGGWRPGWVILGPPHGDGKWKREMCPVEYGPALCQLGPKMVSGGVMVSSCVARGVVSGVACVVTQEANVFVCVCKPAWTVGCNTIHARVACKSVMCQDESKIHLRMQEQSGLCPCCVSGCVSC
jgi:hypothetical protein